VTQQDPRIAQRYAAQPSVWPKVFLVLVLVLILALAGWLAWAIYVHSSPKVASRMTGWKVVDEHTVVANVDVDLRTGTTGASCLVRAYAEDHTPVGDATFTPDHGRNQITVRTERRATSLESIGCSADGQNDAR
jgi:hypothetical protein